EDFKRYWSFGAELRLEGRTGKKPQLETLSDMRGDAVLYLWNNVDVEDALGYHDLNHRGIPFGVVFTQLAKDLDESWTSTLSHEALELIGDPEANLLVRGPHPDDRRANVFHWFEMCDAVQSEHYEIDGIQVSNFVLPLYFTASDEIGGRNDFLGRSYDGETLKSFGVNPGGYVGFFNPATARSESFFHEGDAKAARRLRIKARAEGARRAFKHKSVKVDRKPPKVLGRGV
ncbi:MAG TPA: hypothetical protein VG778_10810, partial [Blastocatellia bacterium]|nr:hypothetical protein [Blastocatellia bacterium]